MNHGLPRGIAALLLAAAVITVALIGLVVPIWAIVDCAQAKTGSRRTIWLIMLVLFWGPGSFLYAFVDSNNSGLKKAAAAGLLIVLFGIAADVAVHLSSPAVGTIGSSSQ